MISKEKFLPRVPVIRGLKMETPKYYRDNALAYKKVGIEWSYLSNGEWIDLEGIESGNYLDHNGTWKPLQELEPWMVQDPIDQ